MNKGSDWNIPSLWDDGDEIEAEDVGVLHARPDTFGKSPAPLIHNTKITDGACRLYAHMHWRYGQNKKLFEGRASMAEMLGVTPTTVSHRIQELEAADWIVVIERRKDDGIYRTPIYHVFETQADCRAFRKQYQPKVGEQMRDKPKAVRARKSRKSAGGSPTHKPAEESETNEGAVLTQVHTANHVNSSSHGYAHIHVNSSSHYTDSESYTDSDIPAGAGLAETVQPETFFDDIPGYLETRDAHGPVRNRQQKFKDEVARIWGCPVGSAENTYREQMLRGVATEGEWKKCNIPKTYASRYEPEELPRWERWELARGVQSEDKVLISRAAKVQSSIMAWIDAGKPDAKTDDVYDPMAQFEEMT